MARSITLNGTSYSIPQTGDSGWSLSGGVDDYLVAAATGFLSKAGGTFTLTAEANLGATYGLAGVYFRSTPLTVSTTATTTNTSTSITVASATGIGVGQSITGTGIQAGTTVAGVSGTTVTMSVAATASGSNVAVAFVTNPAAAGYLRLANTDAVNWRNAANSADVSLAVNASNQITFAGIALADVSSAQTLTNKTLTAPVISTISNSGTLTLPTSTDTLVGRATTDTLTNKTISGSSNTLTNLPASGITGTLSAANGGTGVANNSASTLTISGNFGTTVTVSGTTAVTLPTAGTLATLAGSESLTNKTMGSTNTLTGARLASFTPDGTHTLTAPAATDTLVGKATTDTLTNKTFDSTSTMTGAKIASFTPDGTHTLTAPAATDTLVGQATADTLTNKTLTAPVMSSYMDLTEISTPASPASGKVRMYSKSGDGVYFLTPAGTEAQLGSGSGQKNYLQASTSTATGWTASGAGITVTTDTTAADLPRANTTATGIKISGVSGSTAYAYARFTLDAADYNTKLQLQFAMNALSGYVSNDMRIDVYSNTASDYSGTSTRLALSTDSSSVTGLPNLEGTYRTTFDAPGSAAKYMEVRVGLNGTNTHSVVLSDVVCGPGVVIQGAAVTGWTSYSPTVGGAPAADVQQYYYRRVGDAVQIQGYAHFTGAGTSTALTFTLPLSLTGNTASIGGTGTAAGVIGNATIWNGTAVAQYQPQMTGSNASTFGFTNSSASAFQANSIASGYQISFDITVPVNEWAGAGTLNCVQNDVQFAANSGATWDAAASAGTTVYGPAGQITGGALTAQRSKVVRFTTPVAPTDQLILEVSTDSGVTWKDVSTFGLGFTIQNTVSAGMFISAVSGTDVTVSFDQYRVLNGATYGAAGSAWNSTDYWRVRKVAGGQAVGFGIVQPGTSAGLVSASGVPGNTTGNAIAAGFVGEKVESIVAVTATGVGATNAYFDACSISLTAGVWMINYLFVASVNGATITGASAGISTTTGNSSAGLSEGSNQADCLPPTASVDTSVAIPGWVVTPSSTTTYYGKGLFIYSAGTPKFGCRMTAVRIA